MVWADAGAEAPPPPTAAPEVEAPTTEATPATAPEATTPAAAGEMITVPKAEWEAMKAAIKRLETAAGLPPTAPAPEAPGETTPAPTEGPLPPTEAPGSPTPTATGGGGKFFLLPDISVILQSKGLLSTDTRDDNRDRLLVTEAELAFQGWAYTNTKLDLFVTMTPPNGGANVEEGYVSYLGLAKGLNLHVGRRHVPFGRVNTLHNHSWLYVNPPKVLRNLVASESLEGQGADISYVLPTPTSFSGELDLGTWTGDGPETFTPASDFGTQVAIGPGAAFSDKFQTARLWLSKGTSDTSELEVGGSLAQGPGQGFALAGPGTVDLSGVDVTFRKFGEADARLLLRGEALRRRENFGPEGSTAQGYYLFGNWRPDNFSNFGLLYDWSEFPQAPTMHESAISFIYTKQFTEQYYLRWELTHGSRPGASSYNELWMHWCWGIGPHTHNLE